MSDTYELPKEDLRTLLICSFRYALGRQTYMPTLVQQLIKKNKNAMNTSDFFQIADEIDRMQDKDLGADFDARDWRFFANWCRQQVSRSPGPKYE